MVSSGVIRRTLGTFSRARIKSRDFRHRQGSGFMIPSHSFSTSVSLQTEMPKQILVVKKSNNTKCKAKTMLNQKNRTTSYGLNIDIGRN